MNYAPIHRAIIDGYSTTGVTIMYMGEKMDNGDIISQRSIEIEKTDNVGTLHDKLSLLGAELLIETLPDIISGKANRTVQNEEEVTFGYNISREDEHIDFNKTKAEVYNQIRGFNPGPVSNAILNDEIVKLYKDGLGIKVSDGEIIIKTIKPSGKKKMSVKDYLNGCKYKDNLIGMAFR